MCKFFCISVCPYFLLRSLGGYQRNPIGLLLIENDKKNSKKLKKNQKCSLGVCNIHLIKSQISPRKNRLHYKSYIPRCSARNQLSFDVPQFFLKHFTKAVNWQNGSLKFQHFSRFKNLIDFRANLRPQN